MRLIVLPALAGLLLQVASFAATTSSNIDVRVENGEGVITYQGKKVWSGKVKGQISARSENINGEERAAAYDDGKLIWESEKGAAKGLGNDPTDAQATIERVLADSQATFDQMVRQQQESMKEFQRQAAQAHGNIAGTPHASGSSNTLGSSPVEPSDTPSQAPAPSFKKDRKAAKEEKRARRLSGGNGASKENAPAPDAGQAGSDTGIRVENRNGEASVIFNGKTVWSGKVDGSAPVSARSQSNNGTTDAAAFAGDKVLWENNPGAGSRLR